MSNPSSSLKFSARRADNGEVTVSLRHRWLRSLVVKLEDLIASDGARAVPGARRRHASLAFAVAMLVGTVLVAAPPVAQAAPSPHEEIVALRIDGVGNGHGRGMSQWGAYGRAVNAGQTWQQILDAYYGGTALSKLNGQQSRRVRLVGFDGSSRVGVISAAANLSVHANGANRGGGFQSIQIVERAGGSFQVFGLGAASCGPSDSGWTDLGVHPGPVGVRSSVNASTAAPGSVPGLCRSAGAVTHYRGEIEVRNTQWGVRVMNIVGVEDYLRGVVPREVSPSWGGSSGNGPGMNAIQAQAVAARSYALSQNRYDYAHTCDTTACQAYGGAARRTSATASVEVREHPNSDRAVALTAGQVRVWPTGSIASTEYSASNGPRTAGGVFAAIDDPHDDVSLNPNHRWTRIIPADQLASRYGVGTLSGARTETDPAQTRLGRAGVWANQVVLEGSRRVVVDAWAFRGAFGFPSQGFTVTALTRDRIYDEGFALIGDSTGVGITSGATAPLPALLNGSFSATSYDALTCRRTVRPNCGERPPDNGLAAAARLSGDAGVAVVMLGYNDDVLDQPQIDEMVQALLARGVDRVAWVNLSERSSSAGARYAQSNAALAQAASRWRELDVIDWRSYSSGSGAHRWFNRDGVHLSNSGNAEFTAFLRSELFGMIEGGLGPGKVRPTRPLELSLEAERPAGATGVALNVTVLDPEGDGFATVWPCDAPQMPDTSNINFTASPPTGNPTVAPNAVMVGLGPSSKICIQVSARAHVFVDIAGWLSDGFEPLLQPVRIVDTRHGLGAPRGPLAARGAIDFVVSGAPDSAKSVVMNVTAVSAQVPGYLTVWPCAEARPIASNVNYSAGGGADPNLVITQLGEDRRVCVYSEEAVEVLVDVMGYLRGGFTPITPERRVDTRIGGGGPSSRVAPEQPLEIPQGGAPLPAGAVAVAMNVTAVAPSGPGYLTVWPCGASRPNASNVNYPMTGDTVAEPNLVVASLQPDGRVCVHAEGPTYVLVDISGYFTAGFSPVVPERLIDTRSDPH